MVYKRSHKQAFKPVLGGNPDALKNEAKDFTGIPTGSIKHHISPRRESPRALHTRTNLQTKSYQRVMRCSLMLMQSCWERKSCSTTKGCLWSSCHIHERAEFRSRHRRSWTGGRAPSHCNKPLCKFRGRLCRYFRLLR